MDYPTLLKSLCFFFTVIDQVSKNVKVYFWVLYSFLLVSFHAKKNMVLGTVTLYLQSILNGVGMCVSGRLVYHEETNIRPNATVWLPVHQTLKVHFASGELRSQGFRDLSLEGRGGFKCVGEGHQIQ